LAIHIVAEKEKKLKEFLKIMGLHDTAFWYVIESLLISAVSNYIKHHTDLHHCNFIYLIQCSDPIFFFNGWLYLRIWY
jgi:hypothetical protein